MNPKKHKLAYGKEIQISFLKYWIICKRNFFFQLLERLLYVKKTVSLQHKNLKEQEHTHECTYTYTWKILGLGIPVLWACLALSCF